MLFDIKSSVRSGRDPIVADASRSDGDIDAAAAGQCSRTSGASIHRVIDLFRDQFLVVEALIGAGHGRAGPMWMLDCMGAIAAMESRAASGIAIMADWQPHPR